MKKIQKILTVHLSTTTLAIAIVFIIMGYLLGNVLPITGKFTAIQTTGDSQTGTGNTQTGSGGPLQISDPFDDDPVLGDKKAPVTVIEFSDFQCPFCRRFYVQTLGELEKNYVDTGKVSFVYRDFPLDSIHPSAVPAALASQCAYEQNKWGEMHNKIYDEQQKQGSGTIDFSVNDLKKWASEINGIDANKFNQCLDSQKYLSEVQKDFTDGVNLGVTGTPTFYIGNSQRGFTQVVGAQPYSSLKTVIDQYLS